MIFPDYHLHTSFSSDCDTDIYKLIENAKEKNITSFCVTDHYDIDFPVLFSDPDMDFYLDTDKYFEYMSKVKKEVAPSFDLRIGVELGVMPSVTEKAAAYVKNHPELDFVICSTHIVDGFDPYFPEYYEDKTDAQAYRRYFEEILQIVKNFHSFNVYGHIDYIVRYGRKKDESFSISDHSDILKEIFKIIVSNGCGIEINTGSLYRGLSYPHPHSDILKLYKEAGGEIITVGSDTHDLVHVGHDFEAARALLINNGFQYYCTFKNQQPEFIRIS
ncbi:MAG: histidinol-phosphatase HisJ family protein [Lachnospiraceae bacterium]|nr:histidinol-phosphatase HisJ family protein [Lachnospiraceae bacterium]